MTRMTVVSASDGKMTILSICSLWRSLGMDWSKIKSDTPVPTKDIKASELSLLDSMKLRVISRLLKKSIGSIIQTAIYTYISRNWDDHEDRLRVEAAKEGITTEEMFLKILDESLDK